MTRTDDQTRQHEHRNSTKEAARWLLLHWSPWLTEAATRGPPPRSRPWSTRSARCAPTCGSRPRSSSCPSRRFQTVVDRLVKAGHDEIVVVPLLLTEAYHAKVDVPTRRRRGRPPRHADVQIRATVDPRPRAALPRGARPADARGARARPGARARRAGAGRGRLQRPARQPGRRPAGPGLGHAPQAAGHRGVRLERPAGHRRGGARVPRPRAAGTSRSPRCSWRPGFLPDRAAELALEAGAVAVSEPLGAHPELARTILARYAVGAVELVPV